MLVQLLHDFISQVRIALTVPNEEWLTFQRHTSWLVVPIARKRHLDSCRLEH